MLRQKSLFGDCFCWMEQDCGSWFPMQQFDWQSPDLNYPGSTFHLAKQNTVSSLMNPATDNVSLNGSGYLFPRLLHSQVDQATDPSRWFYCPPRFHQAFVPALNSVLKEKFPAAPYDNCKEASTPRGEFGCPQRRFLVFDQSGDQTTLIFRSGIGTPVQCSSWNPKSSCAYNLDRDDFRTKENINLHIGPSSNDECGENSGTDVQSEMHEDTEELNALLYSDDESDYTEDDEVTSTGHSPSIVTTHEKQDWFDGSTEDIASSDGCAKKRKLFDGGYNGVPSLVDTACSVKPIRGIQYEYDVESKCANGMNSASNEMGDECCSKRIRKERIRETVSTLQDMRPGGKGKVATVVLDDAIE